MDDALNATRQPLPPMPPRIAALPRDPRGFPIPFFVQKTPVVDFRVSDTRAWIACHKKGLCWVCGGPRGRTFAFVAGPMCAVNRTSSEPPSHRECAEWSAKGCPFLSRPRMRRNEKGLPEESYSPGISLRRNPGVALVWVARTYTPFRTPDGGALIEMGEPLELLWLCQGRPATRAECEESIASGLPHLLELCDSETTQALRDEARADLGRRLEWVRARLPAEARAA